MEDVNAKDGKITEDGSVPTFGQFMIEIPSVPKLKHKLYCLVHED